MYVAVLIRGFVVWFFISFLVCNRLNMKFVQFILAFICLSLIVLCFSVPFSLCLRLVCDL